MEKPSSPKPAKIGKNEKKCKIFAPDDQFCEIIDGLKADWILSVGQKKDRMS
jgi:hypothetical protein